MSQENVEIVRRNQKPKIGVATIGVMRGKAAVLKEAAAQSLVAWLGLVRHAASLTASKPPGCGSSKHVGACVPNRTDTGNRPD